MSLKISNAIYYILSHDEDIVGVVGTKLFPIAADEDVKNPFIVYQRGKISPTYSKDGLAYDQCEVHIACVSDDYDQSVTIADYVRTALEMKVGTFSSVNILSCHLDSVSENWGVDNYIQVLVFRIITVK